MTEFHNILTLSGYWARYQEIYSECRTDQEAWERLEQESDGRFGVRRYESYESFRVGKHRFYSQKRKARDIIR